MSRRNGQILNLPDTVQTQLNIEIREQYNSIVLRPEVLEPQMQAILDRSIALVQREILQICSQQDDNLRQFIRNETQQIERFDKAAGWVSIPPGSGDGELTRVASICSSASLVDSNQLVSELLVDQPMGHLDAGVNDVILRLSRPFATKLVSFLVLPLVATAVAGGITLPFIGVAGGLFAGVLAGGATSALIIGFSSSAAVDWLLTRADEAVSRDDFEANLRHAVNTSATRFEDRVAAKLTGFVNAQYNQVTLTLLGHKR